MYNIYIYIYLYICIYMYICMYMQYINNFQTPIPTIIETCLQLIPYYILCTC